MKCTTEETEDSDSNDEFDVSSYEDSEETEISAHPTDVIIAVYQCSDFRLKQEISTKISSCQFAVPLLLPASDSNCYFNLWPMRSIIKNWRPHNSGSGFTESSMVTARFPVISFIRVGECGVSKSKLLNKILSGSEQHNFFFHRDLECGRTLRKLSNGLVEVCWYLPSGSENLDIFTDGITILNLRGDAVDFPKQGVQRIYFLEMLKYDIDLKSRQKLATLREEYKKLCESSTGSHKDLLQKLDKQISETSIGLEHVMREIGQIYEICTEHGQCAALSQDKINLLPNVAADLLLDGYPLELLDGDVGYVLINWVTKVLSELARKVEAQSRIFVLTVLGVQGTGKSTLLNTMFGLQLPVSNGRCTKGAFLQIINVSEELKQKLKCDYVFVMDTEGLKAPELDNLQSSYEHDNELATFVIGLSDVTLVNISMENLTEMKDVLEIVLHAFIRMKDSVKIPTCFFVHQNVGDVSANDVNIRDRQNLVDILNKITKAAAKMELKEGTYSQFSDVMHYDPQRNTFYIPGLMQGNPPMASVNPGYSDKVFALKKYVFQHIEEQKRMQAFSTITEFTEHVRIIWKAVKTEEFIFNFQNSLVAVAYNEASKKCSDLEWSIKKHFNSWSMNRVVTVASARCFRPVWVRLGRTGLHHALAKAHRCELQHDRGIRLSLLK
ncbi:interferon-induced very large GTPase 1-like [Amia ocellicauda]|uniref:interferon-induced very large GTPase 1-like n=1 Tax=Amia ocellicauda TaxID=2972642 RepID=UPI003464CB01